MPTAFAKAFIKKAQKVFPGAKNHKHRTGKSYGPVAIPDGSYTAVVTAETGVVSKGKMEGTPFVRFNACVNQGPHEGLEPSKVFFCEGKPLPTDPDEFPTAEQQLLGLLGFLLPDIQIDDVEQVEQAIEEVNNRGPVCIIGIRSRKGKDGKDYQDVYFNKIVKEASFDQTDHDSSSEGDGASDAETTEVPVSDYSPSKGDMVLIDGDDDEEEWEILQVSQSRKTVNLVNADGTKKNGVSWDNIVLI